MKINTDGVLIGALLDAENPDNILDIGTGTGVIALMLAQRFGGATINAVEIDESAAQTAQANFSNSPFADRLRVYAKGFVQYFDADPRKYDLVVSNPPFYINSLASPGAGKNLAKHANAGFFEALIKVIPTRLSTKGAFWLILPLPTAQLLKFGLQQTNITQTEFVIYIEPKQYSGQYRIALQDFFTIFP